MKTVALNIIAALLFAATMSGCNGCSSSQYGDQDVYVAGSDGMYAVLWKNGKAKKLTKGTGAAEARIVYVAGSDVYVAEIITETDVLWKNGEEHITLAHNTSEPLSIYATGSDVYVAGFELDRATSNRVAALWKNMGETQRLTDGSQPAEAHSVYMLGNDVYAAGYERNNNGISVAVLWKNGVAQKLTSGTTEAVAQSVYALDGDVYVTGIARDRIGRSLAVLWKNGVRQKLPDYDYNIEPVSVYATGNDMYVAGYYTECITAGYIEDGEETGCDSYRYPILWKNGVTQKLDLLEKPPCTSNCFTINSVYALGSDVYVAGTIDAITSDDNSIAILWKNGVPQKLSNGKNSASANSVFAVERKDAQAAAQSDMQHIAKIGYLSTLTPDNSAEKKDTLYITETGYVNIWIMDDDYVDETGDGTFYMGNALGKVSELGIEGVSAADKGYVSFALAKGKPYVINTNEHTYDILLYKKGQEPIFLDLGSEMPITDEVYKYLGINPLENTIARIVKAYQNKEAYTLNGFLEAGGITLMHYPVGIMPAYDNFATISFDGQTPNALDLSGGIDIADFKVRFEELPSFECSEEKWNKRGGIYASSKGNGKDFQYVIVVDNKKEVGFEFGLTFRDGRWWLSTIYRPDHCG
jgi:hypothetical protein